MDLVTAMGIRLYNTMMGLMFSIANDTGDHYRAMYNNFRGKKGMGKYLGQSLMRNNISPTNVSENLHEKKMYRKRKN